jgi:predicted nucleic acid-binding protein
MTTAYPRSRRVFVDTGACQAFADTEDDNHEAALTIAAQLATERRPLFTNKSRLG